MGVVTFAHSPLAFMQMHQPVHVKTWHIIELNTPMHALNYLEIEVAARLKYTVNTLVNG